MRLHSRNERHLENGNLSHEEKLDHTGYSHRASRLVARVCLAAAALVVLGTTAVYAVDAITQQPAYDWYTDDPDASTFTVKTGPELRGLANLVNGTADTDGDGNPEPAVNFEGKTIEQGGYISLANQEFTPIGTEEHPFEGTFVGARDGEGSGMDIRRLQITQGTEYVGLFGYCGAHSTIKDVYLSDSTLAGYREGNITLYDDAGTALDSDGAEIEDEQGSVSSGSGASAVGAEASAGDVIHNVGALVGHTEGSIENCESRVTVSVMSRRQATAENPEVIVNVGGLAGTVEGSVDGCLHLADLSVAAPSLSSSTQDCVVCNIGGVVGTLGVLSDDRRSSSAGSIENCVNGASDTSGSFGIGMTQTTLQVTTVGVGGLDRFGVEKEATSLSVGGICGYSFGAIDDCVNYGLVNTNSSAAALYKSSDGKVHLVDATTSIPPATYPLAESLFAEANGGNGVGGIVGTLRSGGLQEENAEREDTGTAKTPIHLKGCFNVASVIGLANTGGIAGSVGSYASIEACRNGKPDAASGTGTADDSGHIVTTRWNKPMTGGIAGTSYSDISNCANLSEVENIQTGYYTAGVLGSLRSPDGYTSEVRSCFNAGLVHVNSHSTQSYREAGLVGNNGGYVHDSVMRSGSVLAHDDDGATYPNAAIGDDSWGKWSNLKFYSTDDLKTSASAVVLNAAHAQDVLTQTEDEWVYWYINGAYPTLNIWDVPTARTQLAADNVSAACTQLAEYAGDAEAIPTLVVTYTYTDASGEEQQVTLVQDVDFYAIPQAGATAMTAGMADETPYKASIVGIGNYQGAVENVCSYGIGTCSLKNCGISVSSETYNFGVCVYPDAVYVTNPAGVQLESDEYRYEIYSGATYSLTSNKSKNYVVFDSAGYVSWDGGSTKQSVASQHDKLCADLTDVDYLLYNADGKLIFRVADGTQAVVDPDSGNDVNVGGVTGPNRYRAAMEGVKDGGLAGYVMKVSPASNSKNLTQGTWTSGQYVINAIDLYQDAKVDKVTVEVPNADGTATQQQAWYWNSEKSTLFTLDAQNNPVTCSDGSLKQASIDFTGAEIKPDVEMSYTKENGVTVELPQSRSEGYYLIYGDPYTTSDNIEYYNRDATPKTAKDDLTEAQVASANASLSGHERAAVTVKTVLTERFKNYVHMYFTINPAAMDDCQVSMAGAEEDGALQTYAYRGGYGVKPSITLTRCGNTLIEGHDYEVSYANNTAATTSEALQAYASSGDTSGLASVTVTGLGNVEGSWTAYYAIGEGRSLAEEGYYIPEIGEQSYNGRYGVEVLGGLKLANDDASKPELSEGVDYTVQYSNNVNPGVAQVRVTGINGYTGTLATTFKIVAFDLDDPSNAWRCPSELYHVSQWGDADPVAWDGSEVGAMDVRSVLQQTNALPLFRRVCYVSDWHAGTLSSRYMNLAIRFYTATDKSTGRTKSVTQQNWTNVEPLGTGEYTIDAEYYFDTTDEQNVSNRKTLYTGTQHFDLSIGKTDIGYNPTQWVADSTVYDGTGHEGARCYYATEGEDYDIEYFDNVEAGTARYVATAREDSTQFKGSYTGSFVIEKFDLADATVTVADQAYTGRPLTPNVRVEANGVSYAQGTDYTVEYLNNTSKGTANVIVTGVGSCEGTAYATFKIGRGYDISKGTVEPIVDQLYTGDAVTPKPVVSYEGKTLVEGTDYTLSYTDNTEKTTEKKLATVSITGIGSYANSKTSATFAIVEKRDIAKASCTLDDQVYTGEAVEPDLIVSFGNESLAEGADYTVSYRRNIKAGKQARAVITGCGSYEGSLTVPFKIVVKNGTLEELASSATGAVSFAAEMAELGYPDTVRNAVLVDKSDVAAQLAATPLAAALCCPILLSDATNIPAVTQQYLREHSVGNVTLVSSSGAPDTKLEQAVEDLELSKESISGADAGQLSSTLAASLEQETGASPTTCYIVNPTDLRMAATAATAAAAQRAPLLFTGEDGTLTGELLELARSCGHAFVVGSYASVDASVDDSLAARISCTRLGSAASLAEHALSVGLAANGSLVASKSKVSTQLVSCAYAAQHGVLLVSASTTDSEMLEALAQADSPAYGLCVLGGADAFQQSLRDATMEAMGW